MRPAEYARFDATGLADLVRAGDASPRELVTAAIEQIESANPSTNAVVHRWFDAALAQADAPLPDGPFRGVPFLLKDLLSWYEGEPITSGSRLFRGWRAPHDTEIVRRCRAAGLVTLGRTNAPEFGVTPFTEPELFGPCRNPWDTARTTGGSSGGAAAAVASGMVPMAGGGDGGGSIRIPASCCGLFGLKPTRGRTPTGPDQGELWRGAVVEHVLTRSVRDSASMLDALAGPDVGAPYATVPALRPYVEEVGAPPRRLRIAASASPLLGHDVDAACVRALGAAVTLLESLGHDVAEAAPTVDREDFNRAFLTVVCGEVRADLDDAQRLLGRVPSRRDVEYTTWALALLGRAIPASTFAGALRTLQRTGRTVGAFFERFDVFVSPTLAAPPVPIGALQPPLSERRLLEVLGALGAGGILRALGALERSAATVFDWIPFTPLANATGQPAMSVPLAWSDDGLPIGIHFTGRYGDEATLFRLAAQLEEAAPWGDRHPPPWPA
jgi:amidase